MGGIEPHDVGTRVDDGADRGGLALAGPMVATILVRRMCRPFHHRNTVATVDRILVPGLRAIGVHGVLPEEQVRAQPFEVDLELHRRSRGGGESDDLADTVSYADVIDAVRRVVVGRALRAARTPRGAHRRRVQADPRVTGVVVEVRKLRAAGAGRGRPRRSPHRA